MLLIHQGTTPVPGTEEWDALSAEEQGAVYAAYGTINQTPGVTPGERMAGPEDATTVRVADGQTLVTDMDGRYGLQRDLRPGEEEDVPLVVTAPKEPGDYVLEVDLIQEQVAWFSDKGSPTARAKVTVVR